MPDPKSAAITECSWFAGRGQQARLWLGAGAMTLGVGAAMMGGVAVAAADTGDGTADSTQSSSTKNDDATSSNAGPAANRKGTNDASTRQRGTVRDRSSSETGESSVLTPQRSSASHARSTTPGTGVAEAATTRNDDDALSPAGVGGSAPGVMLPVEPEISAPTPDVDASVTETGSANVRADALAAIAAKTLVTEATEATPGGAAVAPAAASSAMAFAADNPFGLPTPSELLRGIQEFGANLYITVMNQLYGIQRSLTVLRNDVLGILGFSEQVITRALPFGNPAANAQYFATTGNYLTSALATVAMAYAQLTNTSPDLQGFFDAAALTDSMFAPGTKMYLGPQSTRFVHPFDGYELLQDRDVRIIMRTYGADQWSRAFNDLTNGLQDPTKAMIVPITGPVAGRTDLVGKTVVVLGVDNVNGTVTINDPTRLDGQGLTMGYDEFMAAWAPQKYQLTTTQLSTAANVAPAAAETRWVWALPSVQQIASGVTGAFVRQLQGFQQNITELTDDLSRTFGVAQPEPIAPPSVGDIEYGNYLANYQYWKYQGNFGTCALMATSAVIAQLTGNGMPVDMDAIAAEVQRLAGEMDSGVKIGQKIYKEGEGGTYGQDVLSLLNKFGINADYTTYLKTEGSLALDTMTAALSQGQSVMVSVNNKLIYDAWTKQFFGNDWEWYQRGAQTAQSNHAVTVLSVNMTKGVVYINDSAPPQGQGLAVPLDQFMKAWETSYYALTTAELDSSAAG